MRKQEGETLMNGHHATTLGHLDGISTDFARENGRTTTDFPVAFFKIAFVFRSICTALARYRNHHTGCVDVSLLL